MGNTVGCSPAGERLLAAARDGDVEEARATLGAAPRLVRYFSAFAFLSSPLHLAAVRGHAEVVGLLLESGADVNSRNYCGQTALMQACRQGHWKVVQTLLLYRSNVMKVDFLNGRTALHFAASEGHARCIRLLVADFIPSIPGEATNIDANEEKQRADESTIPHSSSYRCPNKIALSRFINKPADGGITAIHMAAVNGHASVVHLLLDLHANVSATMFHYGSSVNLIGAGSTPLHFAACGGDLKCCQLLLANGASRLSLNCNGWLPVDVARIWGRSLLEPWLAPKSKLPIPTFPPSSYLSLPMMSILNIARECKLKIPIATDDENDTCSICLERACAVAAKGCGHELCVRCALYLCSTTSSKPDSDDQPGRVPCPICRTGIVAFVKLRSFPRENGKQNPSAHSCSISSPSAASCTSEIRNDCFKDGISIHA